MSERVHGKSSCPPERLPIYTQAQIKQLAHEQRMYDLWHAAGWSFLIAFALFALVSFLTC